MWTTVYISQTADEAEKIKAILENEEIIVKNKRVCNPDNGECYFEISVPSREVAPAHKLIIDAEL